METPETTTETTVAETSLTDEALKTFVLTAAATAGLWGTLLVGGFVYGRIQARRARKVQDQELHDMINKQ